MHFLEVEDTKAISTLPPTKPTLSDQELSYEEVLKKDLEEQSVPEEQREKTMKCLMKVLDYQLKSVQEQAKDIEQHYQRVDKEL
jgi:hypothetical protein